MRRLGVSGLLLGSLAWAQGAPGPPDAERSAWAHRRAVRVPQPAGHPFAALELPPEAVSQAQSDLRDMRLTLADGSEIPYVIDRLERRETRERWSGVPSDAQQERRQFSAWTVDLGGPRRFERVEVDMDGEDFAKRARLEASDDGQTWRTLRADAGLFERAWGGARVRHTQVQLDAPAEARYLRLTLDDRRSSPLRVTGLSVEAVRPGEEARWRRPATLRRLDGREGWSRYRLQLELPLAFEALELQALDPAFHRAVRLTETRQENGQASERLLGEGTLYRLALDDEPLRGESLRLEVQPPQGGELCLEIQDGDSPALHELSLTLSGPATRLIFPAAAADLWLYYGNAATRAPLYDLEALQERLRSDSGFVPAVLGDEALNPLFARPVPLQFAAGLGAAIESPRWRFARPFVVSEREDLYTFTLESSDLARLRPDFADLRLVDEQDRQVPYILEPDVAELRVPLRVEPDPAAPSRRGSGHTSRYRLRTPPVVGASARLPLVGLELSVQQTFFSRQVRLLAPPERSGRRSREETLFDATLARREEQAGALGLALNGRPRSELLLEIDEGDDQPLVLSGAVGLVRVPRVAFKARPGSYRVLMGNDESPAPRYDLAALSREVLAWSAVPVRPAAAADNPVYRRRASDYFESAPPTLLLWGTLLVAVLGLVYLTARVLGRSVPPAGA